MGLRGRVPQEGSAGPRCGHRQGAGAASRQLHALLLRDSRGRQQTWKPTVSKFRPSQATPQILAIFLHSYLIFFSKIHSGYTCPVERSDPTNGNSRRHVSFTQASDALPGPGTWIPDPELRVLHQQLLPGGQGSACHSPPQGARRC